MIVVRLFKGQYLRLRVKGHAMSGPYGEDIVCAAVSALTINLVNSLETLAELTPQEMRTVLQDGDARMVIWTDRLTREKKQTTHLLLKSYVLGIRSLEQAYPESIIYLEGGVENGKNESAIIRQQKRGGELPKRKRLGVQATGRETRRRTNRFGR